MALVRQTDGKERGGACAGGCLLCAEYKIMTSHCYLLLHTLAYFARHRLFMVAVERAMRQCTGNQDIYAPWWDEVLDSQAPEKSVIWKYFGGDGKGGCVADGPFANLQVR